MLTTGQVAPPLELRGLDGASWKLDGPTSNGPTMLVFIETDCPTCQLALPYLDRLAENLGDRAQVVAISQDDEPATRTLAEQLPIRIPVLLDGELAASRAFDPESVPSIFMIDSEGQVTGSQAGFHKEFLNRMAAAMFESTGLEPREIASDHDGAPATKPGCVSRHREVDAASADDSPSERCETAAAPLFATRGKRASRIELAEGVDPYEYCRETGFGDPLPVVPPTLPRVEAMLEGTRLPPDEIIAHVPTCYGPATVEKIAANAVMAGCEPAMMRVLIPLVRAVCDERFNIHGIQSTTHFAAPLVIVNGPIRRELGFASGRNVFSNVARANSTLGRALQLILLNLGGAGPEDMDMSTLGNPGKFSFCIAENEEESPWDPLSVELGFGPEQSTVTLFACDPPRGVSEHTARGGEAILKTISRQLATVWTYKQCLVMEAVVVICPEHVKTLARDGFTKQQIRERLYEITGVPLRAFDDDGEGTQYAPYYEEIEVDGEPCYRKFGSPDAIRVVVAGGTAGKFSAVLGSWATGPRGSQMVTYPVK